MAEKVTKEKRFSAQELCSIISACHKNNVSELSLGTISIKLHPKEVKFYAPMPKDPEVPQEWIKGRDIAEDLTKPVDDEHTRELLENVKFTETLINNPVEFENQMIDSLMDDNTERTTS